MLQEGRGGEEGERGRREQGRGLKGEEFSVRKHLNVVKLCPFCVTPTQQHSINISNTSSTMSFDGGINIDIELDSMRTGKHNINRHLYRAARELQGWRKLKCISRVYTSSKQGIILYMQPRFHVHLKVATDRTI